jgi:hypothetical protein
MLYKLLSLNTAVNVPTVTKKQKTYFFIILKATDEMGRIRIWICNPVNESKDPDHYQNVTDPEHWLLVIGFSQFGNKTPY